VRRGGAAGRRAVEANGGLRDRGAAQRPSAAAVLPGELPPEIAPLGLPARLPKLGERLLDLVLGRVSAQPSSELLDDSLPLSLLLTSHGSLLRDARPPIVRASGFAGHPPANPVPRLLSSCPYRFIGVAYCRDNRTDDRQGAEDRGRGRIDHGGTDEGRST